MVEGEVLEVGEVDSVEVEPPMGCQRTLWQNSRRLHRHGVLQLEKLLLARPL